MGIAPTEEWRFYVDQKFNVTHWPYIQEQDTYYCVQRFFSDSFYNIGVQGASVLRAAAAVLSLILLF